ncbi:ATP-binding protein [Ancylomarina sp. 16SWW S1-10-2]|uniref:ATP-binding protein n=1 Tax=Ancylomarina sp. 16SWW S1-10-2 TaxID=2499681 RepID=UPI0012AD5019|nr:ATP-binding protein [Ancylomarina sp. 16SWW S1-10-2]MRT94299.1 PAS domain S-box protein [Ancylomarina sp. 16SWW S1-10-2]
MRKIKHPKFQTRLFIGLLLIILSFSISSVFYYRDIQEINKVTNDIFEHPYTVNKSARDIDIYINAIHRSMSDIVLSENEIELNNSINLINRNEQLIYDNFKIVREKFLGDLELMNNAFATFVNWKPIRDEIINLVKNGDKNTAAKIAKGKGNDHILLLLKKTGLMIDYADEKAASFNQNLVNILNHAKSSFLLFFIGALCLGIIIFLWIFYSISSSINNMIKRIKNASGDKIKQFPNFDGNQLTILDYAISEFENREKTLEEKVNNRTNELRKAQNLLESSIENANIGIVTTTIEGKIQKANNYFCDFVGYSKEELINLNYTDITTKEDKLVGEKFVKEVLEGNIKDSSLSKAYVHKSGKIIFGQVSLSIIRDSNNQPNQLFTQIRDITKQKKYELELATHKNDLEGLIEERTRELNDKTLKLSRSQEALTYLLEDVNDIRKELEISNNKLLDANKELEAFSYSVSHDLKAPLRAIIGFSQILKEDYAPQLNSESNRYINLVIDNAENMGQLITDLLEFSRMARTKLDKSQVDLLTIVQRVKRELEPSIQNRKISYKIKPLPLINADEKLIYHVVQNLISNAVKFTSKVENAIVEIGCTNENKRNVFYIKDNGIGFNKKYAGRIFDVFQRLHTVEEFPGTGIGLSIVQRIILKHGGKIWVESEINKGTTFFFTL